MYEGGAADVRGRRVVREETQDHVFSPNGEKGLCPSRGRLVMYTGPGQRNTRLLRAMSRCWRSDKLSNRYGAADALERRRVAYMDIRRMNPGLGDRVDRETSEDNMDDECKARTGLVWYRRWGGSGEFTRPPKCPSSSGPSVTCALRHRVITFKSFSFDDAILHAPSFGMHRMPVTGTTTNVSSLLPSVFVDPL